MSKTTKEVLFESTRHSRRISTDNGHIIFVPSTEMQDDKETPFGECNITLQTQKEKLRLSESEIRNVIQGHDDYTEDPLLIGKRGVWPKTMRMSATRRAANNANRADVFKPLDDDILAMIIKKKGGKVPKNAPHDKLVEICVKLHSTDDE